MMLSQSSEESLKNHFMLVRFFFLCSNTKNPLYLSSSYKNAMENKAYILLASFTVHQGKDTLLWPQHPQCPQHCWSI